MSPSYRTREMHGVGPGGKAMLQNGSTNCPIYLCGAGIERPFLSFPEDEYWSVRGKWSEACQRGVFIEEHYGIAIDPKGRWVAAGGTEFKGIKVWNLATQEMQRYSAKDDVFSLCSSPDGRFVVGVTGRAAIIWEIGSAAPVYTIPVKTGNCYSAAWSKDALYLLSKNKIFFWSVYQ